MTRLACALSLALLVPPLWATANAHSSGGALYTGSRKDDDRGSGRLSRAGDVAGWVSFRGSGRVEPRTPNNGQQATLLPTTLAYRGSGRITEPRTGA